jgi:pimeloyl-ACP methyl ester carboxylesterase
MQVNAAMTDLALFIHSTATGPFMWKPYLADVPQGMPVLMPPNRGYAQHDLLPHGTAFSVQEEVRHLLAQLPEGTTGVHLAAHSYGGFAALTLARQLAEAGGPLQVRSLWLYEPVLFASLQRELEDQDAEVQAEVRALYEDPAITLLDPERGGDEAWIERFIDYWNQPGMWASMPDKAKMLTRAVGWKMFTEVNSVSTEPEPFEHYRLDGIALTLVHGQHTRPPARQMARRLAQVNPHAEVHELEGLGHMSLLSAPLQVAPSLKQHWQRAQA